MRRSREDLLDAFVTTKKPSRLCAHSGCLDAGQFRAPRSRAELGDQNNYLWFCLEHVRAYNAAWNYYQGMSDVEIEHELRHDTVWQRPTWPMGWRVSSARWHDPLHAFDGSEQRSERPEPPHRKPKEEDQALAVFELDPPFGLAELKARYKRLVKLHHPDANGGSKEAEERLKIITRAYAYLKQHHFG